MSEAIKDSEESPNVTSTKDKLALVISIASFAVSAFTLTMNRLDAANAKTLADQKYASSAFQLGKRFSTSRVVYSQVHFGDAEKVAAAKKEALNFSRDAQAYAVSLDLNIDLASLIENDQYKNSILPEDPSTTIETRLTSNFGPSIAGKFLLGYWLAWLHINSQAAISAHPEYLPQFKKDYPHVAALVNKQLTALGLSNRLSKEMPDLEMGKRETLNAMQAAEDIFAKRGGF